MHLNSMLKPFRTTQIMTNKLYRLATFLVVSTATILLFFSQIQSAHAHSLAENVAHNGERNGQGTHHGSHGNRHQNGKLMQNNDYGSQNRCQLGWVWYNNKCWVTDQSRRDFTHAMDFCRKKYNSTLPTIHSEEENEFLRQKIDLQNSPIWIYARHNHQYNQTRWLDKSPVNYTRWGVGQPNDKSSLICIQTEDSWYMRKADTEDGQTECVSFWEDAKWGTQVGCRVMLPVVCEKKLTPRYSDGSNGTITSQFEQQQMYPVNGADSIFNYSNQPLKSYPSLSMAPIIILFNQLVLSLLSKRLMFR